MLRERSSLDVDSVVGRLRRVASAWVTKGRSPHPGKRIGSGRSDPPGHSHPNDRNRRDLVARAGLNEGPLPTDCVEKVRRRRSDERMIRDGARDGNEPILNGPFRFEYCSGTLRARLFQHNPPNQVIRRGGGEWQSPTRNVHSGEGMSSDVRCSAAAAGHPREATVILAGRTWTTWWVTRNSHDRSTPRPHCKACRC